MHKVLDQRLIIIYTLNINLANLLFNLFFILLKGFTLCISNFSFAFQSFNLKNKL